MQRLHLHIYDSNIRKKRIDSYSQPTLVALNYKPTSLAAAASKIFRSLSLVRAQAALQRQGFCTPDDLGNGQT